MCSLFKSQGLDTRVPGSHCGDLQGITCSMELGLDFDAVTEDEDLVCLGAQIPHMVACPLVKDHGDPKHMKS